MSRAEPMSTQRRVAAYRAQNGSGRLTARQQRRIRGKQHESHRIEKGFPARPGRLRRRYDAKDQRKIKAWAADMALVVRLRKQRKGQR